MKTYRCKFIGRQVGAIGITFEHTVEVQATDPEGARLKCYDTHEHISGFEANVTKVTRYAVTHINKDGMRVLTFANQGRNHPETKEAAQLKLDLVRQDLRDKVFGSMADTLEVRPVECYWHGDAIGIYFKP